MPQDGDGYGNGMPKKCMFLQEVECQNLTKEMQASTLNLSGPCNGSGG